MAFSARDALKVAFAARDGTKATFRAFSGVLGGGAAGEALVRAIGAGASVQFALGLCVVALCTTVPLALLPPGPAACAVTAAGVLSLVVFHTITVAGIATLLIVLYRASSLVVVLAVLFLPIAITWPGLTTIVLAALAPAAALGGVAVRARAEAAMHRTARQAVAETLVEHTARGERARIARELHDVVAHHISMIAVQAETARLATPGMPQAGARRLAEIGDTARAGLTEMRRLLGVLREDAGAESADRHPQPGLQELNELLDDARHTSGAGTRLIVSGSPSTVDPGVELAVYRIVQEALTNARRHAPGAAVDVELHYQEGILRLRIRDNGPGVSASDGGHGLAGMRERAAAVGGNFRAGPAAVGGFLVEATLPAKVEQ